VLSPTDLAKVQAVVNASMTDPLIIDRPTNTSGAWGNNTESFTNIAGGSSGNPAVLGMLMEPSVTMMTSSGLSASELAQWEIRVPNGTNLQENDRVTLSTGLVLRVQGGHTPMTSYRPIDIYVASAVR
jgi:hypothetical protein